MSTLTLAKVIEAAARVETLRPAGIEIWPTAMWPQVEDGIEVVRWDAHPLVQWLSRWLPITPYIEATYPKYRDADPILDKTRGILFCSYAQADYIKRSSPRPPGRR